MLSSIHARLNGKKVAAEAATAETAATSADRVGPRAKTRKAKRCRARFAAAAKAATLWRASLRLWQRQCCQAAWDDPLHHAKLVRLCCTHGFPMPRRSATGAAETFRVSDFLKSSLRLVAVMSGMLYCAVADPDVVQAAQLRGRGSERMPIRLPAALSRSLPRQNWKGKGHPQQCRSSVAVLITMAGTAGNPKTWERRY
jgi:hypothetical protein